MLDSLQGISNLNDAQKDRLQRLEAMYGDMESSPFAENCVASQI